MTGLKPGDWVYYGNDKHHVKIVLFVEPQPDYKVWVASQSGSATWAQAGNWHPCERPKWADDMKPDHLGYLLDRTRHLNLAEGVPEGCHLRIVPQEVHAGVKWDRRVSVRGRDRYEEVNAAPAPSVPEIRRGMWVMDGDGNVAVVAIEKDADDDAVIVGQDGRAIYRSHDTLIPCERPEGEGADLAESIARIEQP